MSKNKKSIMQSKQEAVEKAIDRYTIRPGHAPMTRSHREQEAAGIDELKASGRLEAWQDYVNKENDLKNQLAEVKLEMRIMKLKATL